MDYKHYYFLYENTIMSNIKIKYKTKAIQNITSALSLICWSTGPDATLKDLHDPASLLPR